MMKKILCAAIAALGIAGALPAFATPQVLYNSWNPIDTFPDVQSYVISGSTQGWAIKFNSGLATTLTEVNAFVTGNPLAPTITPTVSLQMSIDVSGIPSSTLLWNSGSHAASSTGIDITGLSTSLTANTNYWLAILPSGLGNEAHWQSGNLAISGPFDSFSQTTHTWTAGANFSPAAIIRGTSVNVATNAPEPASLALFGVGLLATAAVRRRRQG